MRTIKTLTLDEAIAGARRIISQAKEDGGEPIAVSIVGVDGREIVFAAMDDVLPGSIDISKAKAFTAVELRKDTIEHHTAQPPKNAANYGPGITFLSGGAVIKDGNKVVAGIGVSGRRAYRPKEEDDPVGFKDPVMTDHELACLGRDTIVQPFPDVPV